jgi:hypothetical protein
MISCWRWPLAALTRRRMSHVHDRITLGRGVAQRRAEAHRVLPVLLPAGRGRPARAPFGFWYRRCLSSCQRLSAVCAPCRSSALAYAGGSVARAVSRSRRCFHRAGSVSSSVPPVGRGSWGLMPLAARHTAISPMRAVLRWLPEGVQIGSVSRRPAWSWTWSARSATNWDRFAR